MMRSDGWYGETLSLLFKIHNKRNELKTLKIAPLLFPSTRTSPALANHGCTFASIWVNHDVPSSMQQQQQLYITNISTAALFSFLSRPTDLHLSITAFLTNLFATRCCI